jgi:outer membrane protein assembly factor BamB
MPSDTRLWIAVLVLLAVAAPAAAAQPQFWDIDEAAQFLDGDIQGLSIDAFGRVRLAAAAPVLDNPSAPYVWTLARDAKGTVYAGTGNDGKVFRITGGKATLFFDAPELEVHAIAVGKDGKVYVGTSPDGEVYAVDAEGHSTDFFDPEEQYIWAMTFDEKGNLLVATGGGGRVYRVASDGKAETILDGPESHITALAVDSGNIYAGSSPSGVLYRIDPVAKKAFVLQDTLYREIKAIAVGRDGSVYAAAVEGSDKEDATRTTTPLATPAAVASTVPEVTVTESFVGLAVPQPTPAGSARTVESPKTGQTKGALIKLLPSGETDVLWSSVDEMPYALLRTADGVLVGTGNTGKLYRISEDRTWTMLTALPVQQLTAIVEGTNGAIVIASSNPGTLYTLGATAADEGTFISKVRDTETVSSWGRVQWECDTPAGTDVRLETRSGNTAAPDKTWSDWSAPYTHPDGDPIASEHARFLQVRASLRGKNGATPTLHSIRVPYLQRNLRPQVTSITVHPPGEVFQKPLSISGDTDILGLDAASTPGGDRASATPTPVMAATTYSRKLYQKGLQTFSWKGEDPNGDTLTYDVDYRPVHDTRFRPLRKDLTDSVLAWDTSSVPNGRYVVRIVARDISGNPESLALTGEKESAPFDVDNTPPVVTATAAKGVVKATARDDASLIRRAEYSLDGSHWEEMYPKDGINDSVEELYEFTPRGLTAGPHVVVIRATDLLGNVATARVNIE